MAIGRGRKPTWIRTNNSIVNNGKLNRADARDGRSGRPKGSRNHNPTVPVGQKLESKFVFDNVPPPKWSEYDKKHSHLPQAKCPGEFRLWFGVKALFCYRICIRINSI